jgi:hypothetical protein
MDANVAISEDVDRQLLVGKGVGILVGIPGLLGSMIALFVSLTYVTGPGLAGEMFGLEYVLGNPNAEAIFYQAVFVRLVSISLVCHYGRYPHSLGRIRSF